MKKIFTMIIFICAFTILFVICKLHKPILSGDYIKIILLIVILLFLGIIFYFKQNVEFVLIDTYEKINMDFNGDVELINSRKKLEEFYEKENIYYDINMDNSTVILSRKMIKEKLKKLFYLIRMIYSMSQKIYILSE